MTDLSINPKNYLCASSLHKTVKILKLQQKFTLSLLEVMRAKKPRTIDNVAIKMIVICKKKIIE